MVIEDMLAKGKEMSLFFDTCQKVVDSPCQIGKKMPYSHPTYF